MAAFAVLAVLAAASAFAQSRPASPKGDPILVPANRAAIVRLSGQAQNVIIGDPRVVDVTVENRSMLVLFGRSPGETNLIVLDSRNREILSVPVIVSEEAERQVTVTSSAKGGLKEVVYSCGQRCSRVTLKGSQAAAKGGGSGGGVLGAAAEPEEAITPASAPAAAPESAPAAASTPTPEQAPAQQPQTGKGYKR